MSVYISNGVILFLQWLCLSFGFTAKFNGFFFGPSLLVTCNNQLINQSNRKQTICKENIISMAMVINPRETSSIRSHTCPHHKMRWCALEQFLHHFGTIWSSSHVSTGHCSTTQQALLYVFANSNLIFLVLRIANGLHFVVNPLYFVEVFFVGFDTDMPTSWKFLRSDQLLWMDFFYHQGKKSSVIYHSFFPWSSLLISVSELTSAFILLKNGINNRFLNT